MGAEKGASLNNLPAERVLVEEEVAQCGHNTGILTQPISVPAQKVHSCQQEDCRPAAAGPGEDGLQLCLHRPTTICTEAGARHLGKRADGSVQGRSLTKAERWAESKDTGHLCEQGWVKEVHWPGGFCLPYPLLGV